MPPTKYAMPGSRPRRLRGVGRFLAGREVGRSERDREWRRDDGGADDARAERQPGRGGERSGDAAEHRTHAPAGVHAVHEMPVVGPLQRRGVRVHRDVEHAERHAEHRRRRKQPRVGVRQPDRRQCHGAGRSGDPQRRTGADARHDPLGELHRDQSAAAPEQHHDADLARVEVELVDERRRPHDPDRADRGRERERERRCRCERGAASLADTPSRRRSRSFLDRVGAGSPSARYAGTRYQEICVPGRPGRRSA